ncbi:MAG: sugar phosphate isomerase/epimerase [Isosphaeraceae bacterium]|nr:sugar phosphate isomerase/epimerase [Isosphaeraceae bacterium]
MPPAPLNPRNLGTMIVYGYPERPLGDDLNIAARLGAGVVEVLPQWQAEPDPVVLRREIQGRGFQLHSAHGCWGGQTIRADRVDLGHTDERTHRESVDDLKRCIDWLARAGGRCLVVHPGGMSQPEETAARRDALARGLIGLADHASASGVLVCVENMPPGVYPGSRMAELFSLVAELGRPELGLALDTGHAHISADVVSETMAAGALLRTTHVHDNNGRQDVHLPPGLGTIDWDSWASALEKIAYDGPIMLECIRHFRSNPESLNGSLDQILERTRSRSFGS